MLLLPLEVAAGVIVEVANHGVGWFVMYVNVVREGRRESEASEQRI